MTGSSRIQRVRREGPLPLSPSELDPACQKAQLNGWQALLIDIVNEIYGGPTARGAIRALRSQSSRKINRSQDGHRE